jgi:hypothetical protein
MNKITFFKILVLYFCAFATANLTYSQNPNCFRITFSDKGDSPYSINRPEEFLSPRAIAKRERFNIPVVEQDLPINPQYIENIINFNSALSQIISTSKWNNSVVIFYPELEDCQAIIDEMLDKIPYVIETLPIAYIELPIIYSSPKQMQFSNPVVNLSSTCDYDYGSSISNISLHNGQDLHKSGFCGEDMLICTFDEGWENFNTISYFQPLYENEQILGTRDLMPGVNNVYTGGGHGTFTTSIMASEIDGKMIGTAPKANYYLIRTECPVWEQLIEEEFLAQAAEIADSLGADVVSISIGYRNIFDFAWQNIFTPEDNNGIASIASRAASILAQKGVIVVQAAGNLGLQPWRYICRPADAFDILTVGAVNRNGVAMGWSSYGPSADGRVKPDVAAVGANVWHVGDNGNIFGTGTGTSFATPIIAGLSACLWQALPQYSSLELMQLIREYGDSYDNPNDRKGYGIPNFYQLYLDHAVGVSEKKMPSFSAYPNPTTEKLHIKSTKLLTQYSNSQLQIFDIYGRKVNGNMQIQVGNLGNEISIDIAHLPAGFYFLQIDNEVVKIIKQ